MSIAFIGLGHIGKSMALQWAQSNETLWVYDVMPQPVAELVAAGAKAAANPAALAKEANFIGLCVRDDNDVDQLLYGAEGLLENAKPNTIIAIHSTVTQDSIMRWHKDAGAKSIHLVDAPVTRGVEPGTFCYMLGADAALAERCRPTLLLGGNKIVETGKVGAAIALKLCNNLMTYAAFIAMHEANRLAQACGLTPELLLEVGRANGVVTPQMSSFLAGRNQCANMGAEALQKTFGPVAGLGKKDLGSALKSAEKLGIKLPGTQRNSELIEDVMLARY